jgi:small subunit ribosomal protein S13
MLIIFGKKITDNKKVRYALTEIFGVGLSLSTQMCNLLSIPLNLKIADLTESQKLQITTYIKEKFVVDAHLKSQVQNNIQNYIDINSVRGFRHRTHLPVRGQRTHSNGKTRKKLSQ